MAFSKSCSRMNSLGLWARLKLPQPTPGATTGTPCSVNRNVGVVPPLSGQPIELDVLEALLVEVAPQLRLDVVRVLLRHQSEVDLARRPRRDHRLRARSLVAAADPGDVAGRVERRRHDVDAPPVEQE